jgi:hypothetical protein
MMIYTPEIEAALAEDRSASASKLGEIVAAHIRLERALSQLTPTERTELATMICDIRIAAE